jgi:hypothetical protein
MARADATRHNAGDRGAHAATTPPERSVVPSRLFAASLLCAAACSPSTRQPDAPPAADVFDIVTAAEKTALVFEVDSVVGRGPDDGVTAKVSAQLDALIGGGYLDKPAGATFTDDEELPALGDPERVWTFAELDALAASHRSLRVAADTAVIHVVYVDGRYEDDGGSSMVLGFAWGGDSIVMLKDNIERACRDDGAVGLLAPGLADTVCRTTEYTVLLHEIGHLMGLVNNGAPMQSEHQDTEHGAHDVNEDCLMYWLNDQSSVVDAIAERIGRGEDDDAIPFDDACLADLRAAGDEGAGSDGGA